MNRVAAMLLAMLIIWPIQVFAAEGEDPAPLTKILEMKGEGALELKPETKNIRLQVVKEYAHRLGVQTGAQWRNDQINEVLQRRAPELDSIFAFGLLLIDGQVLPPVVIQSDQSFEMKDRTVLKTGTSFKIIQDARFVSVPPSWRDFLFAEFKVQNVSETLYPRTSEEVAAWKEAITNGWALGIKQADNIFELNMRKLTRDMNGLILFRELAGQGFVSLPKVAEGKYAIRVGDKTLDLDQTSFTLVEDSRFQQEDKWKPFQMNP